MSTARILVLADEVNPALYDYFEPGRLKGIDLIISCGDLPADYLSFLVTVSDADLLYVPGNHDDSYEYKPPEGCICIDSEVYNWRGLTILGLGGSMRYKPGPCQYTQKEMGRRAASMWFKLLKAGKLDILVTHAPAQGINDGPDLAHSGFKAFTDILSRYHPACFVHGHVHMNYGNYPRISNYQDTTVVNAFGSYVLEVELPETD